jgi:hypothetical protein
MPAVKRYLIEPESVAIHEPDSATPPSDNTSVPKYKVVYRIIDTATRQIVPPESEDLSAVARTCTQLNESDEKAKPGASSNSAAGFSGTAGQLPDDIVQAIAISNAKSIGEQPAILANLSLAQQVFNQNMQQQLMLGQQQAMNILRLAAVAKCVSMIESTACDSPEAIEKITANVQKILKAMDAIGSTTPNNNPPQPSP